MNKIKERFGSKKTGFTGFTLVELLVVIFIIAILASVIIVSLERARMKSRDNRRKSDLATIQQALEMYYADNHKFPTATEGTGQCSEIGTLGLAQGFSSYLAPILHDPQGSPDYIYRALKASNGAYHYIIISTLENESDLDYNRNYNQTYWGSISDTCLNNKYGSGKTYHYFVSSD